MAEVQVAQKIKEKFATVLSKMNKGLMAAGLMLSTILGASVAFPGTAQAYAYSCTGYGWISVPRTSVATSRWCGETNGSGRYVSQVKGGFTALVAGVYLCNTSLKAEFFDDHGRSVGTYYSGTTGGCWQAGGVFAVGVYRTFATDGHVRISLLSYGAEKAAVEHNIHR